AGASDASSGATDPRDPLCKPMTCLQMGAGCGAVPDGCGGVLRCGACADGELCDGETQLCRTRDSACESAGKQCGVLIDACGEAHACGTCSGGEICDAASGQCGACKPRDCSEVNACGSVPDGCGGTLACGGCFSSDQACDALSYHCQECAPT